MEAAGYWLTKLAFQRGLALVYLIAFIAAAHQFKALLGERGLLPVNLFARNTTFQQTPSIFLWFPKDIAFSIAAWIGIALSLAALIGLSERFGTWPSMVMWGVLWALYAHDMDPLLDSLSHDV